MVKECPLPIQSKDMAYRLACLEDNCAWWCSVTHMCSIKEAALALTNIDRHLGNLRDELKGVR